MSCVCVDRHVPLPQKTMRLVTGGTVYDLCPTTYYNVMELITEYRMIGNTPPGSLTKHYSKYVRDLAASCWTDTRHIAEINGEW